MVDREPHCVISFDTTCPRTCKLYDNAAAAYKDAIEFTIKLGMSREEALEFYWDRTPQEKVTREYERAQYLKDRGIFDQCNFADTFKNKGLKQG